MVTYTGTIAAASATQDSNLSEGQPWQRSSRPRRVAKIGLSGSTAIGDTGVDVLFGSEKVMHLLNTGLTTVALTETNQYWHSSKLFLRPGVPLNLMVTDPPTTNALFYFIDIQEMVP